MPSGPLRVVIASAVIAALAIVFAARPEPAAVVVSDRAGKAIATVPIPDDGRFSLRYRHSIYEAPAYETFEAGEGGRFALVELASPSGAVLDYYALEGRRRTRAGWRILTPDSTQSFKTLPLIATSRGKRTLVVGERRVPLFGTNGARHLVIRVRGDNEDP